MTPRLFVFVGCALAISLGACIDSEENDVQFPNAAPAVPRAEPAPGLTSGCNDDDATMGRLLGRVYPIPSDTKRMPEFRSLAPVGTLCLDRLDISERHGQPGFPGISTRNEFFSVDLRGAFRVDEAATYSFRLTSDDGAMLFVDGQRVIENDGFHSIRSAERTAQLTAGPHSIAVPYWQGPGPLALTLEVARAGGSYEVFRIDEPLRASVLPP